MSKEMGEQLAAEKHAQLLSNPVAVELGLDDPNGPATVLGQALEGNGDANVVYMYLLDACEKMFAGDLDQTSFEEHMRWFFGNRVGFSRESSIFEMNRLLSGFPPLYVG